MSRFRIALDIALSFEGGYVNDPADRGGATKWGVTQAVYDAFRRKKGLAPRPVIEMTPEEMQEIYFVGYWETGKCALIPAPLDIAHFDACINHGPVTAWKLMQRAIGVKDDGIPGSKTMEALGQWDINQLIWRWLQVRADFYCRIVAANPSQAKFIRGWINRRVFELFEKMRKT